MVRAASPARRRIEVAHLIGAAAGGITVGLAASLVGSVATAGMQVIASLESGTVALATIAIAALVGAGVDLLGGVTMGFKRQTPRSWRYLLRPGSLAFFYGFDLGMGSTTRVYYMSFPVLLFAVAFTKDPLLGALTCGVFGLARAGTTLVLARAPRTDFSSPEIALTRSRRLASVLSAIPLLLLGGTSAASLPVLLGAVRLYPG